MRGLTILQRNLQVASEDIQIANHLLLVISKWNRRKDYEFENTVGEPIKLFGNSTTFNPTFEDVVRWKKWQITVKSYSDNFMIYQSGNVKPIFANIQETYSELLKLQESIQILDIFNENEPKRFKYIEELFEEELK